MKKFLIIIILLTTKAYTQIGWANLATNQCVSWQDLSGSGVPTKATAPTAAPYRLVNKDSVIMYYWIDPSNTTYKNYTSNQIITKASITAANNSATMYDSAVLSGNLRGWSTTSAACAASGAQSFTVYWGGTLGVGTGINFQNSYLGEYPTGAPFYYKIGNYAVTFSSGWIGSSATVATITSCVTYYTWILNAGGQAFADATSACNGVTGGTNLYSSQNGLITNTTTFYTDNGLSTLFNGGGSWYKINLSGSSTFYAAQINASGVLTSYTTCSSDIRLKTNIHFIGKYKDLNLYTFEFKDQPGVIFKGVIAQELIGTKYEKYIMKDNRGYYMVNYPALGFLCQQINKK